MGWMRLCCQLPHINTMVPPARRPLRTPWCRACLEGREAGPPGGPAPWDPGQACPRGVHGPPGAGGEREQHGRVSVSLPRLSVSLWML